MSFLGTTRRLTSGSYYGNFIIYLRFDPSNDAVAQLVQALRCKREDGGFDSRWGHWHFPLTQSYRPHYGPVVDSASNRNEYRGSSLGGKGGRCVRLTVLPISRADCLEIVAASTSYTPTSLLHLTLSHNLHRRTKDTFYCNILIFSSKLLSLLLSITSFFFRNSAPNFTVYGQLNDI